MNQNHGYTVGSSSMRKSQEYVVCKMCKKLCAWSERVRRGKPIRYVVRFIYHETCPYQPFSQVFPRHGPVHIRNRNKRQDPRKNRTARLDRAWRNTPNFWPVRFFLTTARIPAPLRKSLGIPHFASRFISVATPLSFSMLRHRMVGKHRQYGCRP